MECRDKSNACPIAQQLSLNYHKLIAQLFYQLSQLSSTACWLEKQEQTISDRETRNEAGDEVNNMTEKIYGCKRTSFSQKQSNQI